MSFTLLGEEPKASVSVLQASLGRKKDHSFRVLDVGFFFKGLGLGLGFVDVRNRDIRLARTNGFLITEQVDTAGTARSMLVVRGSWVPMAFPVIKDKESGALLSGLELFYEYGPPLFTPDRFESFGVRTHLPFVRLSYQRETTRISRPWPADRTGREAGSSSRWRAGMEFSVFIAFQALTGWPRKDAAPLAAVKPQAVLDAGPNPASAGNDELSALRESALEQIRQGRRNKGMRLLRDACRGGHGLSCNDLAVVEAQGK